MRKIIILFFTPFILLSCSGEDDNQEQPFDGVLLKKTVTTSAAGTVTTDYSYYRDFITDIHTAPTKYIRYNYQSNYIMGANRYDNGYKTNSILYEFNYLGQVTRILNLSHTSYNGSARFMYSFNDDGTISVKKYKGSSSVMNTLVEDSKLFWENGNISKKKIYKTVNTIPVTITHTYAYDNKNNPLNRIQDFRFIMMHDTGVPICSNNLVSTTITATNTSDVEVYTSQYTYNDQNYPISKTDTNPDGSTSITQFTY